MLRAAKPPYLHLEDVCDIEKDEIIADVSDIASHGGLGLEFGHFRMLVQRFEDQIVAFENRCPHAGTPLDLFEDRFTDIRGEKLLCRTHGALFDPVGGRCIKGPCKGKYLRRIAIKIENGHIIAA